MFASRAKSIYRLEFLEASQEGTVHDELDSMDLTV